jgi:23S rRNA (cytosine1962-C5)-methyltransferase
MTTGTYQLIDSGNFQKLEQVGPYRFVRPAAQAVWRPTLPESEWKRADASFTRFSGGDGKWQVFNRNMPPTWQIKSGPVSFQIKMTDFGHLGIFPEQDTNWQRLHDLVKARSAKTPEFSVLNLFAYTGGSTLACATGGAKVVHVDASKTSVAWARVNAEISGHAALPVRWITDDVKKFVGREVRRGSKYHGIILDPPSYGRGPAGESWQIETDLTDHLAELKQILAEDFSFILLSAHSTGYTPMALQNLVGSICDLKSGNAIAEEMVVTESIAGRPLPSGACCLFIRS